MADKESNEDTDSQSSQGSESRGKGNKIIGQIIEEMAKCEVLYNIHHKEYRIKSPVEVKRVALKLGISEEKVKTQISYVKMMYKKQEYRMDFLKGGVTGSSGDGASEPVPIQSEEPVWVWYDACAAFMKKVDLSKMVTTEKYDKRKAPAAFKKMRVAQENSQGVLLVRDYPRAALSTRQADKSPPIQSGHSSPIPSTSRDIATQKFYTQQANKRHHEEITDPLPISSDSSPEVDRTLTNVQDQGSDLLSTPVPTSAKKFSGRLSPIHITSSRSTNVPTSSITRMDVKNTLRRKQIGPKNQKSDAEPTNIDEGIMDVTIEMIRSYMRHYSRQEQLRAFGEMSVCMHSFNKKQEE